MNREIESTQRSSYASRWQTLIGQASHSNKSQTARQWALFAFHQRKINALVATYIVARGIDIEGISYVINCELPNDLENYSHR